MQVRRHRSLVRRGKTSRASLVVTAVILVGVALLGNAIWGSVSAYAARDAMLEDVAERAIALLETAPPPPPGAEAVIRGRIAVVNVDGRMGDMMFDSWLPDDLLAQSPDEVETVFAYAYSNEKVGVYRDADTGAISGDAYSTTWTISVIDLPAGRVVAVQTITNDPKRQITHDGDGYAAVPRSRLANWIKSLPRS